MILSSSTTAVSWSPGFKPNLLRIALGMTTCDFSFKVTTISMFICCLQDTISNLYIVNDSVLFCGGHSLAIASHGQKGNTGKPAMTRSFVPLIVATLFLAAASFTNAQQTSKVPQVGILQSVARRS